MNSALIPNMMTFLNLTLGVMSLIKGVQGDYATAGLFILSAGMVDRYDGRIARALGAESPLGKELDSLSDMVSFGVAPAILAYFMFNLHELGLMGLLPVILFPIAGAYRLARFNSCDFDGVFTGIPITLAGCLLAMLALLLRNNVELRSLVAIMMIALAYLEVSTIKFKKF